jgi:hypothetical protein
MGIAEPFCSKLKHLVDKLILYNKIEELKRTGNKRMFQYEKPG